MFRPLLGDGVLGRCGMFKEVFRLVLQWQKCVICEKVWHSPVWYWAGVVDVACRCAALTSWDNFKLKINLGKKQNRVYNISYILHHIKTTFSSQANIKALLFFRLSSLIELLLLAWPSSLLMIESYIIINRPNQTKLSPPRNIFSLGADPSQWHMENHHDPSPWQHCITWRETSAPSGTDPTS